MIEREVEFLYKVQDQQYVEGHSPTTFVNHFHYLRGARGGVSFSWRECLTPESLPERVKFISEPMGIDLGYHRPVRTSEYQYERDECQVLDGRCFGDGSSMQATTVMDQWQATDRDPAWLQQRLTDYYHDVFYELDSQGDLDKMGFGELIGRLGKVLDQ